MKDNKYVSVRDFNIKGCKYYTDLGLKVIPMSLSGGVKRPLLSFDKAFRTHNDVDNFASYYKQDFVPSLLLEDSNYLVIDCDIKNGENGVFNFENFLKQHNYNDDYVYKITTISGGRHYYFKLTSNHIGLRNSVNKVLPGVDVRVNKGLIVAPYATINAKSYYKSYNPKKIKNLTLLKTNILPNFLYELLTKPNKRTEFHNINNANINFNRTPNNFNTEKPKGLIQILQENLNNVLYAVQGERNDKLFKSACVLARLESKLNKEQNDYEKNRLLEAGLSIGLSKDETILTIQSAYKNVRDESTNRPNYSTYQNVNVMDKESDNVWEDVSRIKENREIIRYQGDFLTIEQNSLRFNIKNMFTANSPAYRKLIDYIQSRAYRVSDKWCHATALTILSQLAGRRFFSPTRSNLTMMSFILGPSGTGKHPYIHGPKNILYQLDIDDMGDTGMISSAPVLEKRLEEKPVQLLTIDECHNFIDKITSNESANFEKEIKEIFKQIYSFTLKDVFKTSQTLTRESTTILTPHLSFIGASTITAFFDNLHGNAYTDGFVNRCLYFIDEMKEMNPVYGDPNIPLPDCLKKDLESIAKVNNEEIVKMGMVSTRDDKDNPPSPIYINFDNQDTFGIFNKFAYEINKLKDFSPNMHEMIARMPDTALRIATLIAVSRDKLKAQVTKEDLLFGINITMQSSKDFLKTYLRECIRTPREKNLREIYRTIKSHGEMGMDRRQCLFCFQHLEKKLMIDLIQYLYDQGMIEKYTYFDVKLNRELTVIRVKEIDDG